MPQSVAEPKFLAECLQGNRDAVLFVQRLIDLAHFWDDLIDGDKKLSHADINGAMQSALVDLPLNPFYQRHLPTLMPLVIVAIHNWKAATDFERGSSEHLKQVAFVLRSSYVDVLVMCAHLIGGWEHASEWVPRIREIVHDEGFDGFKAALEAERAVREPCLRFDRREAA